jgi:hypothetical protein
MRLVSSSYLLWSCMSKRALEEGARARVSREIVVLRMAVYVRITIEKDERQRSVGR